MFSGWGIYKDGIIFGIIAEGQLYFKVDGNNLYDFKEFGSHPFVYPRKDNKSVTMSYWLVTEEVMDNRDKLYDLVEKSVSASSNR